MCYFVLIARNMTKYNFLASYIMSLVLALRVKSLALDTVSLTPTLLNYCIVVRGVVIVYTRHAKENTPERDGNIFV